MDGCAEILARIMLEDAMPAALRMRAVDLFFWATTDGLRADPHPDADGESPARSYFDADSKRSSNVVKRRQ